MKLIDDWRDAWRLLSIRIAGVAVVFGALPSDQQQSILELLHVPLERVPAVLGLVFIAGRLWAQKP